MELNDTKYEIEVNKPIIEYDRDKMYELINKRFGEIKQNERFHLRPILSDYTGELIGYSIEKNVKNELGEVISVEKDDLYF